MKRTIEIDDVLDDCKDSAIDRVKEVLENYLEANSPDECPDWGDLDYSGTLHEIIDGAVPIYTHEVEAAWYLYGNELEAAYEDARLGNNPRENNGMAAIYCYLEQKAQKWFSHNAELIFNEWRQKRDASADGTPAA